jgi:uncharacterized protein YfcZ (UPF0381/DUF406 family)
MTASLNPYISQFGEEFDAEKSSQYRMAIQFTLGGLSFALLDTKTQTLVGLEFYQSDLLTDNNDLFRTLERALESKGLNNKAFQEITCIIDNRFCTLVPEPLFNEADQAKYLDFSFQVPENYTIISESSTSAQCRIVYAFPKALQDKMLAKWKDAKITHSSSVFINSVMEKTEDQGVFVNVRNADFDMVIKKDRKLQFFNNFKFNTKEDFAYFLLFAMEQNGCSGQDTPVTFAGLILPSSEITELCKHYVRDIHFVEDPYYFIHYQALR